MPQHPKYSNSPIRDLDELYVLLEGLETYGFMHEETYQQIDWVMQQLYLSEARKFLKSPNRWTSMGMKTPSKSLTDFSDDAVDVEEATEFNESDYFPSAAELFYDLPAEQRAQFIVDLRNAIGLAVFTRRWFSQEAVRDIEDDRDMDNYFSNVRVIEDSDVLEKFRFEEKSDWHPPSEKPLVVGVYSVSTSSDVIKHSGFSYWDGVHWYKSCILLDQCVKQRKSKSNIDPYGYWWRGFAERQ